MNNHKFNLIKIGYQICFLLGLSGALVAIDVLPRYEQGNLTLNNEVLAQTPSDSDLRKYANALIKIESLRLNTYSNIRNTVKKSIPDLACNQPNSFNQLPNNARSMAVNYCEQSENIVKQSGLTIVQFNQITQQVKQNPALYQKLEQIIGK